MLGGLDLDVRDRDEDLVQEVSLVKRFQHNRSALAVQVTHSEFAEETLVCDAESDRVDSLLGRDKYREALFITAPRAKTARSSAGRDDDHTEMWSVEHRHVEVQSTGLGVNHLQWEPALPVSPPELIQRVSESAFNVGRSDEIGLIPERLSAKGDGIRAGTEIAHELQIGESTGPGKIATGDRADGIVMPPGPLPREDSVLRRNHVRVDPGTGWPRRWEAERLDALGVRRGRTVWIARLGVLEPGDLRPISLRHAQPTPASRAIHCAEEQSRGQPPDSSVAYTSLQA